MARAAWAFRQVFDTNVFAAGADQASSGDSHRASHPPPRPPLPPPPPPRGAREGGLVPSLVGLIVVPWLGAYCASNTPSGHRATMKGAGGYRGKVATTTPRLPPGFTTSGSRPRPICIDPEPGARPARLQAGWTPVRPGRMIADMVEIIAGDDHSTAVKPPAVPPHPPSQAAAWEARA